MAGRVLIIAEAANPEWVSVPLVGWSLYQALAQVADVHLVTQVRNRDAVIRAGLIEGRDFTAIDNEWMVGWMSKLSRAIRGGEGKGWTTGAAISSIAYYSFEYELWRRFEARIRAGEFALVHRITPLSPTSPSIIAKRLFKLGVPFVVGPLNGGVPWPKGFIDRQMAEREWLSSVRRVYKLLPGYRSTRKYASAIIVGSNFTREDMPPFAHPKCVYIPENGIDLGRFGAARSGHRGKPLKAAFVGRLVPYKGADILLEATADYLRAGELAVEIVGDGPQRGELEELCRHLDVVGSVRFHGWMPHEKVQDVLRSCDFLGFPSIREFGGGVVLEAMALGVVPVVADYAGPGELVDQTTGIRVVFRDKESLVAGFRDAIGDLIRTPDRLNRLRAAAQQQVLTKLTWEAKAGQIMAIYDAVLHSSPLDKLDFFNQRDREASRKAQ